MEKEKDKKDVYKRQEQLSGVRDIRIFERNNSFFVNAEIRGEAQLSVPITRTDYQLFKENTCRLSSLLSIRLKYMLPSRHTVMIRLPL